MFEAEIRGFEENTEMIKEAIDDIDEYFEECEDDCIDCKPKQLNNSQKVCECGHDETTHPCNTLDDLNCPCEKFKECENGT